MLYNIKIPIIKKMSFCIYKTSQYYLQAKSNPTDIIQPIGYDSLHAQQAALTNKGPQQKFEKEPLNFSDLSKFTIRTVYEKSLLRTLSHYRSQRLTPELLINQYLKISELQRKNEYLSGNVLQFIINAEEAQAHIISELQQRFFPIPSLTSQQKSLIEVSQLLYNPPFQGIYYIGDYAISKYFILFENSNEKRIDFISDVINRKLLGYDVQVLRINHEKKDIEMSQMGIEYRQREAPSNYAALRQILDLIDSINNENKKLDPFYSGINLYFGDYSEINRKSTHRLLKRQIRHLPILQYYLLMLTGLLAHNQSAILKLEGSFQHKTVQFLYILNLIFDGKITLSKPLGSNPFTNSTYVLCEHYNKQMGKIIHRYLIVNFGLLYGEDGKGIIFLEEFLKSEFDDKAEENKQYLNSNIVFDRLTNIKRGEEYLQVKEQKLLIDIKKLIKDDFQSISQFNDSLIYRGVQMNVAIQKKYPNAIYFPNKMNISEKLAEKHCKDLSSIIQLIPEPTIDKNDKREEEKKNNADKLIKKQADFSMLTMLSHPRIEPKEEKAKSKHKKSHHHHHHDRQRERSRQKKKLENQQKKNPLESFLERIKQKNEEDKKAKGKSKSKKK